MTRIIDWEKHNVPVCWEPSHEKWAVEVLISNFYNLCGSNPWRWHWQDDQESPDSLQNHGWAGQAASLDSVFLAAILRISLCSIIPWKQERNTNVWESSYETAIKEAESPVVHHLKRPITLARALSRISVCKVQYILGLPSRPWQCLWTWCMLCCFSGHPTHFLIKELHI